MFTRKNHIWETVTDSLKRFIIPDPAQKVCEHLKGRKFSRFGCGQKYFMIQLNRMECSFVLACQTQYLDLQCFKSFQIVVERVRKRTFTPFEIVRHKKC